MLKCLWRHLTTLRRDNMKPLTHHLVDQPAMAPSFSPYLCPSNDSSDSGRCALPFNLHSAPDQVIKYLMAGLCQVEAQASVRSNTARLVCWLLAALLDLE